MSEATNQQSLFAGIEAAEAALFRAGQQARQLLTARHDLPRPCSVDLDADPRRTPLLLLGMNSEDDLRSWADALGAVVTERLAPGSDASGPYVSLSVKFRTDADVDGMRVWASCSLLLTAEEWQARQGQAGAAPGGEQ